jgi:hypothetical protein
MINQNHVVKKTTNCSIFILSTLFLVFFIAVMRIFLLHFTFFCLKDGLIKPDFYPIVGAAIASFVISIGFIVLIDRIFRNNYITKIPWLILISLPFSLTFSFTLYAGFNQYEIKNKIISQYYQNRSEYSEKYQTVLNAMRSEIHTLSLKKCVETKTKNDLADSLGNLIRSYFIDESFCTPAAHNCYQALLNKLLKQHHLTDSCKKELLKLINRYDLLKSNYNKEMKSDLSIIKFSIKNQIRIIWELLLKETFRMYLLLLLMLGQVFLLVMIHACKNKITTIPHSKP